MGSVSKQSQACSRSERFSAFVDGEWADEPLPSGDWPAGLSGADRAAWSDYHLIGDALRSDDLAVHPAKSDAFLRDFSARLAAEPHLLAPAALHAPRRGFSLATIRRRVVPGVAIAAAAATLSWIVLPQLQRADVSPPTLKVASVAVSHDAMRPVAASAVDTNLIRDARLDQYLEAHQEFSPQPMVSDSGPFIRAAALSSQGR